MRRLILLLWAVGQTLQATPVEVFTTAFAPLDCETAALSPDGKLLAYIGRGNGGITAYVIDVDAAAAKSAILLDKAKTASIVGTQILWISSDRFLVQLGTRDIAAMDADGSNIKWIVDWTKPGWFRPALGMTVEPLYNPLDASALPPLVVADPNSRQTPLRRVRVVALPTSEPGFAYVEAIGAGSASGQNYTLHKVNVATGAMETVRQEYVPGFLAYDRQGRARLRFSESAFPNRWDYLASGEKRPSWQPLDHAVAGAESGAFEITTASFFANRSIPVGFDHDPDILYIASNAGRNTYGVYALNIRSGHRTSFAVEHPAFDLVSPLSASSESSLVFDRAKETLMGIRYLGLRSTTMWLDADLAALQRKLEARFPSENIQIEHWDTHRERFLVQMFSRSDPGAYGIYERTSDQLRRFVPRSSKIATAVPSWTTPWEFSRDGGGVLSGDLTMPARPRSTPVPVVVFFRQSEWSRQFMKYNPEILALSQMGFAVLEVNHRGLAGFGVEHWQTGRHHADSVAAEDALLALDHLATQKPLDRSKVSFFGNNVGGYFALRAAQLFPERTACVVTINPITDLVDWIEPSVTISDSAKQLYRSRGWFFGDTSKVQKAHSPISQVRSLTRPVMVISTFDCSSVRDFHFEALRKEMKAFGNEPVLIRVSDDREASIRNARVFAAIDEFLEQQIPVSSPQDPLHGASR